MSDNEEKIAPPTLSLSDRVWGFIKTLPLVRFIIDECKFGIYGGFIRWIQEFEIEHKRMPTTKEGLEFLISNDIDFDARGNRCKKSSMKKIHAAVIALGGRIEYMGDTYDGRSGNPWVHRMSLTDNHYLGGYRIWIPRSVSQFPNEYWENFTVNPAIVTPPTTTEKTNEWIFYDIWLQATRAKTTTADFTANTGTFYKRHCVFAKQSVIRSKILEIFPGRQNGSWHHVLLRLFRVEKMLKRGYKPSKDFVADLNQITKNIKKWAIVDFNIRYNAEIIKQHIENIEHDLRKWDENNWGESEYGKTRIAMKKSELESVLKDKEAVKNNIQFGADYKIVQRCVGDKSRPSCDEETTDILSSKHEMKWVTYGDCVEMVKKLKRMCADYR